MELVITGYQTPGEAREIFLAIRDVLEPCELTIFVEKPGSQETRCSIRDRRFPGESVAPHHGLLLKLREEFPNITFEGLEG